MKKLNVTFPKEEVEIVVKVLNDEKIKYTYNEDGGVCFLMTIKELIEFLTNHPQTLGKLYLKIGSGK